MNQHTPHMQPANADTNTDADIAVDPRGPIPSAAELHQVLERLLQTANIRQLWLLFFDDEHRIMDPIMPMDDYPLTPDTTFTTDEGYAVPFIDLFVLRVAMVAEAIEAASFAVVWERRGSERFTAIDLGWARSLTADLDRAGIPLRGQYLLHTHGLREISPDDYA